MTDEEFIQRKEELLTAEYAEPERWIYLSFADKHFNGAVVIKAHGLIDAIVQTHTLGINPGGQVFGVDIAEELIAAVPEADRSRLLSEEDVMRIWPDAKSIREHKG